LLTIDQKPIEMITYGLIGKKLSHSFSKKYFTDKFSKKNLTDHHYQLFELENIDEIQSLFSKPDIKGLNVTVPYKVDVIPFIDELDDSAKLVGAVNVIKISEGKKSGFNSDYYGFKLSLEKWVDKLPDKALILGTGGAAKAVAAALKSIDIEFMSVSRSEKGDFKYDNLSENIISSHPLIINTTPLGMSPDTETYPDIPYEYLTENHFLYDLVYNPEMTAFMSKGKVKGCKTKNGLEMLHLQAEKSWEIWNS